ncbi:MAG TPA: trehalose-phosphatase [Candidatus Limnocylindrales bacterium]|nr:trehalose-phosphatase [Candidatus Limnocylindrales bacterium]
MTAQVALRRTGTRVDLGELVVPVVQGPAPLLVVSDFDGTLSPMNPDPLGARILPLARTALRRLARLSALRPERVRLVVLSGRTATDVAARVRVGGVRYMGNHGLEGGWLGRGARAEALEVAVDEAVAASIEPADALGRAVAARLREPEWLFVEEKGPSVAFHYRMAADPVAARAALDAAIESVLADEASATEGLLDRIDGRKVVEFRPAGAGGKGASLDRLLERERPGTVLILGDDRADAEAFEALRRHRAAGRTKGLIVGVHGAAETPAEVVAGADVVVAEPAEAARLLSAVARQLEQE